MIEQRMKRTQKVGLLLIVLVLASGDLLHLRFNLVGQTVASAFLPERSAPGRASDASSETGDYVAPVDAAAASGALYSQRKLDFDQLQPLPPTLIDTETLWLARAVFSETKRREEQELVAWVIRNRVETQYRGRRTYRDVVLDPYQFSAFIPGTRTHRFYTGLDINARVPGWKTALSISYAVRHAPPTYRPFPSNTRHCFSEQSMVGRQQPRWAEGMHPVDPDREYRVQEHRFRFFTDVF
jgi:hypothetical protein